MIQLFAGLTTAIIVWDRICFYYAGSLVPMTVAGRWFMVKRIAQKKLCCERL